VDDQVLEKLQKEQEFWKRQFGIAEKEKKS